MEVSDLVRSLVQGLEAQAPAQVAHARASISAKLDSCGSEERHREIARKVRPPRIEANADREGLDQVFAVVAVVEGAGSEEERHGGIHGRLGSPVPRHDEAHAPEGQCIPARNGQVQCPDGLPAIGPIVEDHGDVTRSKRRHAALPFLDSDAPAVGRAGPGRDVRSRSAYQVQHILIDRRRLIPRRNRP